MIRTYKPGCQLLTVLVATEQGADPTAQLMARFPLDGTRTQPGY